MELRRRCLDALARFFLSLPFFFVESDAEELAEEEHAGLSELEEEVLELEEDRLEEPERETSSSEEFMSSVMPFMFSFSSLSALGDSLDFFFLDASLDFFTAAADSLRSFRSSVVSFGKREVSTLTDSSSAGFLLMGDSSAPRRANMRSSILCRRWSSWAVETKSSAGSKEGSILLGLFAALDVRLEDDAPDPDPEPLESGSKEGSLIIIIQLQNIGNKFKSQIYTRILLFKQ